MRTCAAFVVTLLLVVLTGGPAAAHGAPTDPLSRAAGCRPGGTWERTPACAAAIAAGGTIDWDNIRVADVDGRDRQEIPDGKLCSAGLGRFRGLDLPRGDWPTNDLPAGGKVTFSYRSPIPHQGTFRWYLTRDGYSPTRPLRWADLDDKPFLTVADPKLAKGAYTMTGTLPAGRTGRHLIYTVWQTNPDTYYSCSDVVLAAPAAGQPGAAPPPAATRSAAAADPAAAADAAAAPGPGGSGPAVGTDQTQPAGEAAPAPAQVPVSRTGAVVPWLFGGGAALALAAALGMFFLRRRVLSG